MAESKNNTESSSKTNGTSRPTRFSVAKDLAAVAAVAIALGTLVQALVEYQQQGAHERAKYFFEMRHCFKDSEEFKRIASDARNGGRPTLAA
jgi:hypothetical protein